MKWTVFILAFAALLALAPASAQAAMSFNHFVTDDLPHAQCMAKARTTMRKARLSLLEPTSEAVWAETSDRNKLAAIYCLKTRDVAVVTVAGKRTSETRPILDRLMSAWRDND
jgi:hypothetical protein